MGRSVLGISSWPRENTSVGVTGLNVRFGAEPAKSRIEFASKEQHMSMITCPATDAQDNRVALRAQMIQVGQEDVKVALLNYKQATAGTAPCHTRRVGSQTCKLSDQDWNIRQG